MEEFLIVSPRLSDPFPARRTQPRTVHCQCHDAYVIKSKVDAVRNIQVAARPTHAYVGFILIAVFWPLNWLLPDETLRTSFLFFPLWLGYALTVDAIVLARSGTSILSRSRRDFIWLFLTSAPAWWL